MLELVPPRTFFRFEFPLHHLARTTRLDGNLKGWDRRFLLPQLGTIDSQEPFAELYAGWNDDGLCIGLRVPSRSGPLRCDPAEWWKYDGLRLCVDTRDARDNKRATRFCHFFYFAPVGGGRDRRAPLAGFHRISRAKEPPPAIDASEIRLAGHVTMHAYSLEALVPASCLNGWDPVEHPRIGLFYKIKDGSRVQTLSIADELGWNVDPSTWAAAVLTE
jgi:hypothetical protein